MKIKFLLLYIFFTLQGICSINIAVHKYFIIYIGLDATLCVCVCVF